MRKPFMLWVLLPALAGCLSVCPDARDREAKARLFSMDEPSRLELLAEEPIDAGALASSPDVRRRVLWMSAAETSERLRSFTAKTEVSFAWRKGRDAVRLSEDALVELADSGDFRVTIDNDRGFGMELRWIGDTSYVKDRQGAFRERRADRAGHESWREEAMGQMGTLLELAGGRVGFARTGTDSHEGRPVVKYALADGERVDGAAAPPPKPDWTPDPVYPSDGPGDALLQRLAPYEHGRPTSLSGELWVDEATAAILRADLHLVLEVPGEDDEPAVLDFKMRRSIDDIGGSRFVEVPEHRPFERRPRAVKDPLDWWPPYVAEREQEQADDQ